MAGQTPMVQVLPIRPEDQHRNRLAASSLGKLRKAMKFLALFQIISSTVILSLGVTCLLVRDGSGFSCYIGSAAWVGVLLLLTSFVAIAAPQCHFNQSILITYLVFCIISAILCAYLTIISSLFAVAEADYVEYGTRSKLAINICVAIVGFLFGVSAVVASSVSCELGACGTCCSAANETIVPAVIYVQAPIQQPPCYNQASVPQYEPPPTSYWSNTSQNRLASYGEQNRHNQFQETMRCHT